jgi:sigma-54-specific transcriptional regulator
VEKLLTLPESSTASLSIRAKALVFHDPASLNLLHDVERIAHSDATVLVMGETGTGKELIARHIHNVSGRKGPFVPVNCGAFSESLIDAELFGHEAGAFTGASQARAGWFEAAQGGTLFLDEIGDLPMALQVKLLRVLQERQVVRLGSRRAIALDVRLVAATNIELARAVEAQHFRADLYYRLSVASVRLPPLRERPADIVPLARHFISVYRSRLSLNDVVLSEAAQQALLDYSWPGNIREIENVIHYALIVCRDGVIRPHDIKLVPLGGSGGSGGAQSASPGSRLQVGGLGPGALDGGAATGGAPAQAAGQASVGWPAPHAASQLAPPAGAEAAASAAHARAHPAGAVQGQGERAGQSAEAQPGQPGLGSLDEVSTGGHAQLAVALAQLLSEAHEGLFDQIESALVHAAFDHAGRNQVRAAKVLGITRNMLRTQLKRHGLLGKADEASFDGDEAAADLVNLPGLSDSGVLIDGASHCAQPS